MATAVSSSPLVSDEVACVLCLDPDAHPIVIDLAGVSLRSNGRLEALESSSPSMLSEQPATNAVPAPSSPIV